MLKTIISDIINLLTEHGVKEVYSAFDAVDIQRKSKGIFSVAEIRSFSSSVPIYSQNYVYIPFKADISLRITAPESWTMDRLYTYFDELIAPAVKSMSSLNSSINDITIKPDSNIHRLVLTVDFSTAGMIKDERSPI